MANASKIVHMQQSQVANAKDFVSQCPITDSKSIAISRILDLRIFKSVPIWDGLFGTTLNSLSKAVRCLVDVSLSSIKELFMPHAPLRRVVSRTIEVYRSHNDKPQQFMIIDELECGHTYCDFQWSLLDLVNPYSEIARKKRHECRECAKTLAKKAPCTILLTQERKMA